MVSAPIYIQEPRMLAAHDICFVPHKRFLGPLYQALAREHRILSGIVGPHTPALPEEEHMHLVRTFVHAFGVHTIMHLLKRETQAPLHVPSLNGFLERNLPTTVVAFDIYHWYTLQCLAYKKRHQEASFIIWSESRMLPSSLFSRIAFRFFLHVLRKNRNLIDAIFVYTEKGKAFMEEMLPGCKVSVVSAPVDIWVFYPDQDRSFMSNGALRVLMNARFVAYKGHADLLKALHLLTQKGVRVQASLIGHEGHLKEQIRREAEALGLTQSITFLPSVPLEQMRDIYLAHDVLVLPSRNEAIGMVVPEAMACGIPTVTSDSVGANTYVEEGVTGFIYPTGDPASLAAALEKVADRDTLARFGAAARERIDTHFSAKRVAERFSAALDLA